MAAVAVVTFTAAVAVLVREKHKANAEATEEEHEGACSHYLEARVVTPPVELAKRDVHVNTTAKGKQAAEVLLAGIGTEDRNGADDAP